MINHLNLNRSDYGQWVEKLMKRASRANNLLDKAQLAEQQLQHEEVDGPLAVEETNDPSSYCETQFGTEVQEIREEEP